MYYGIVRFLGIFRCQGIDRYLSTYSQTANALPPSPSGGLRAQRAGPGDSCPMRRRTGCWQQRRAPPVSFRLGDHARGGGCSRRHGKAGGTGGGARGGRGRGGRGAPGRGRGGGQHRPSPGRHRSTIRRTHVCLLGRRRQPITHTHVHTHTCGDDGSRLRSDVSRCVHHS